jgi:hypothetical protein
VNAALELAVAALAGLTFVLFTFDGRGLVPALVLGFALLTLRVRRNREERARRPSLAPGTWLRRLRAADLALVGSFLVLVAVLHDDGGRLEVDGPLLFMQVRSLVIDHDLDYTNEFADFVPERYQYWAEEARRLGRRPDPPVEPGPALLWMPFFLLAHGLVLAARLGGAEVPADGYGAPYVNAVALASLVWAFVGVVLTARICRRWFAPPLAATCAAGAWLATPLVWYSVYEPTMPHAAATAAVAIFLWQWLRVRERPAGRSRWLALALAGGVLVSMQRYDAYFFLAPALTGLGLLLERRHQLDRAALRRLAGTAAVVAAVFLVTTVPLLLANLASRHASVIAETDLLGFTFRNWARPHVPELLFSSRNGLFSWTPVAYVGVVGLILFTKRQGHVALCLLSALAVGVYLLAASYGWHAAWSFGSRRLTEAFPVFVVGLCAAAELVLARPAVLGVLALAGLALWNLLLAGQVRRGEVPRDDTFAFADAASRAARRFYARVGHPSAWPASWIFALRYGVTPDTFDPVFGREPSSELAVAMGTPDDLPFLGYGWSLREGAGDAAFRWSLGGRSTLLVTVDAPVDYRLSLRGAASRHPEHRPQTVGIEVNRRPAGQVSFTSRSEERVLSLPAALWRRGLNEVRLVYAWTVEAGRAYGGADPRRIAFRLERLELRRESASEP